MLGPAAFVGDGDSSAQSKSMATLHGDGRSEYAVPSSFRISNVFAFWLYQIPRARSSTLTLGRNAAVLAHALREAFDDLEPATNAARTTRVVGATRCELGVSTKSAVATRSRASLTIFSWFSEAVMRWQRWLESQKIRNGRRGGCANTQSNCPYRAKAIATDAFGRGKVLVC